MLPALPTPFADEEIVRKVQSNMATCEPAFRDAKVSGRLRAEGERAWASWVPSLPSCGGACCAHPAVRAAARVRPTSLPFGFLCLECAWNLVPAPPPANCPASALKRRSEARSCFLPPCASLPASLLVISGMRFFPRPFVPQVVDAAVLRFPSCFFTFFISERTRKPFCAAGGGRRGVTLPVQLIVLLRH